MKSFFPLILIIAIGAAALYFWIDVAERRASEPKGDSAEPTSGDDLSQRLGALEQQVAVLMERLNRYAERPGQIEKPAREGVDPNPSAGDPEMVTRMAELEEGMTSLMEDLAERKATQLLEDPRAVLGLTDNIEAMRQMKMDEWESLFAHNGLDPDTSRDIAVDELSGFEGLVTPAQIIERFGAPMTSKTDTANRVRWSYQRFDRERGVVWMVTLTFVKGVPKSVSAYSGG
ncbi:MAG: hypothetical protein RL885_22100 [Planctomycetota bacterium]